MGNFDRGNRSGRDRFGSRFGGNRSYSGGRDFNRQREDRQMFQTVCSKCGKECEVPFKPTGDRPVFCSDCFRENSEGESRGEGRNFSRPSFDNRSDRNSGRNNQNAPDYSQQFAALSSKLDKILDLLSSSIIEESTEEVLPQEDTSDENVQKVSPKIKRFSKKI